MEILEVPLFELRHHPKQHLFHDVVGGEWREFTQSLRDEGVQQPLTVSRRTGELVIIDGHQRFRAAQEVGLSGLPAVIRSYADEREEVAAMIASNLKRRNLTRKEKTAVIEEYIKLYPERSDNWLAEDLGANDETVKTRREELEEKGELPVSGSSVGKDGKTRTRTPRARKAKAQTEAETKPEPEDAPEPPTSNYSRVNNLPAEAETTEPQEQKQEEGVMADLEQRAWLVAQAISELRQWAERYQNLEEFSELVNHIQGLDAA